MKLVANHSLCTGQATCGSGKLLCVEKNFCANLFIRGKIVSWKLRIEQNFSSTHNAICRYDVTT